MALVPDVQPYRLSEIATALARICAARGYRIGWTRPVILTTVRASDGCLEGAVIPRDWLGRLVTDMPACRVEDTAV